MQSHFFWSEGFSNRSLFKVLTIKIKGQFPLVYKPGQTMGLVRVFRVEKVFKNVGVGWSSPETNQRGCGHGNYLPAPEYRGIFKSPNIAIGIGGVSDKRDHVVGSFGGNDSEARWLLEEGPRLC